MDAVAAAASFFSFGTRTNDVVQYASAGIVTTVTINGSQALIPPPDNEPGDDYHGLFRRRRPVSPTRNLWIVGSHDRLVLHVHQILEHFVAGRDYPGVGLNARCV